jgi:hypothetical protein
MAFELIQGFKRAFNGPLDIDLVAIDEDDMLAIKWVHKGLVVARIDTSPIELWICTATAATQPGTPAYTLIGEWEEFTGTDGVDGAAGSQIITGTGVPSDVLGEDGDFFLDNNTGNYYIKAGGTWGTLQGNLTGPTGPAGTNGTNGIDGTGAPVYGSIYTETGVGTQTVASGVPEILSQLIVDGASTADITPAAASNKITIDADGVYDLSFNMSFSGTGSSTWTVHLYENINGAGAAEAFGPHITRKLGTGGDVGSSSLNGIYTVANGDSVDLEIWIEGDGNDDFVLQSGNFVVQALGAKGDDGADGSDGAVGKAFIHLENDITLTAAKITSVEGGSWTVQDPWSASVQNDTRNSSELNATAGIIGSMANNSIAYNGSAWFNNGRWLGLEGSPGGIGADSIVPGPEGPPGPDGDGVSVVNVSWAPTTNPTQPVVSPFDHVPGEVYNKRILLSTLDSLVPTFTIELPPSVATLDGLREVDIAIDNNTRNKTIILTTSGNGKIYSSLTGDTGSTTMTLNPYMTNKMGSFHIVPILNDLGTVVNYSVIGGATDVAIQPATTFIVWGSIVDRQLWYDNSTNIYSLYHTPTESGRYLIDIAAQHVKDGGDNMYWYNVAFQTWNLAQTTLLATTNYGLTPQNTGGGQYLTSGFRIHTSIVASLSTTNSYRVYLKASRKDGITEAESRFEGADTFGVTYIK